MIVEFSNEVVNSVFVIRLSLCIETTVSLHRRNVLETISLRNDQVRGQSQFFQQEYDTYPLRARRKKDDTLRSFNKYPSQNNQRIIETILSRYSTISNDRVNDADKYPFTQNTLHRILPLLSEISYQKIGNLLNYLIFYRGKIVFSLKKNLIRSL